MKIKPDDRTFINIINFDDKITQFFFQLTLVGNNYKIKIFISEYTLDQFSLEKPSQSKFFT